MERYDCYEFVKRGDELWSKQNFEFGSKYTLQMFLDGGFAFTNPSYYFADKKYVKWLLGFIREKIDLLYESADIFHEHMELEGEVWRYSLSEDIANLPKEEVIQMFNLEYTQLLTGYEELYKQVEALLKE